MPLFIRRPANPEMVEAEQMGAGGHTHPGQGQRPPRPGDWVVTNHATGQTQVLTDDEFRAQYDLAPVPSHLLAPAPGTPAQPPSSAPPAEPPAPSPGGAVEPFSPSGPTEPMNEGLPGRPAPTPEVRPRLEEPGPVESPTGLPEQPGDADKEFREQRAVEPPPTTPPAQGPEDINAAPPDEPPPTTPPAEPTPV